jgi:hypothetical protein
MENRSGSVIAGLRVASGVHRLAFRKGAGAKGRWRRHPSTGLASHAMGAAAATRLQTIKTSAGRRRGRVLSIFLWPYRTGSRGYLYRGTHPTCTRAEGNELKTSGDFRVTAAEHQQDPRCHHPRDTASTGRKDNGPAQAFLCVAKQIHRCSSSPEVLDAVGLLCALATSALLAGSA